MTAGTLLLAPVVVPLLACGVLGWFGRHRGGVIAVAAVPALVLGLAGAEGTALHLEVVVLGADLQLDAFGRVLATLSGLVWMAAGLSADRLLRDHRGLAAVFLLTMAGNLGVIVAGDVATLYASITVMTFAAYVMVVHERTAVALRAGRVYVVFAVLGEAALLAGLALAVGAAEGALGYEEVRGAVADAPHRALILSLLFAGPAVKVGVVPLHMWLPLAHPVAPTPASAVLSGVLLKAGVVAWIRLLPVGEADLPAAGSALVVLGSFTALSAVLVGVTQRDPKTLLAYSSVSQMGIVTIVAGLALWSSGASGRAMIAVALMAFHHGVAKAALFLGVGLLGVRSSRRRPFVLVGMAGLSLALAGAPLTSGWVAKGTAKEVAASLPGALPAAVPGILSITSVATTVLLARLFVTLTADEGPRQVQRSQLTGWAGLVAAAATGWWFLPRLNGVAWPMPVGSAGELWDGTWPVLVGFGLVVAWELGRRYSGWRLPSLPPGDVVVVIERASIGISRAARSAWQAVQGGEPERARRAGIRWRENVGSLVDAAERGLTRWRVAGVAFALLTAALILSLGLSAR